MRLLWLALLAASARPPPISKLSLPEIDALVKEARALPHESARVAALSQRFLGLPYAFSPLGEGKGEDPDPLVRFDEVDCVTFVEEVLALSRARTLADAVATLQQIRYRGSTIAFAERNHFMEADWIPNNERKGFVRDITARVAGADLVIAVKRETLAGWHRRKGSRALDLPDDRAPVGTFKLPMLPLDKALSHQAQIPTGTILLVVRKSFQSVPNRITHLGIVVHRGGESYLRHASSAAGRVRDEPFAEFVARNQRYEKWPVEGFTLLEPLAP